MRQRARARPLHPEHGGLARGAGRSLAQFDAFNLIDDPCWIVDLDRADIVWANVAALAFWEVASLEALRQESRRNVQQAAHRRLAGYRRLVAEGRGTDEHWTLYPKGRPKTVRCQIRPVAIQGCASAMLVRCLAPDTAIHDDVERRALEAMRHADLLISLYDEAGQAIYRNPAAQAAFGPVGATDTMFLASFVDQATANRIWARMRGGEDFHEDVLARTADGPHWHLIDARSVIDPVRGARSYLVCQHEIDRLHDANQRLAAAERRLRDFAEVAADWFWETDADGRFTYVSTGVTGGTGESPDAIIGKTREELAEASGRPEALAEIRPILDAVAARRAFGDVALSRPKRSGGLCHVSVSGKPVFGADGAFLGYRGATRDITQLVELQIRQKASEERFRDFADVASDWFWEQDEDMRFTYVSSGIERLTGMSAAAHYGRTRRETAPQDVSDEDWARHEADLAARRPFSDFRITRVDPNGQRCYMTISGKPFFDAQGRFKGYRGTGRDRTVLAEAQQQLRQSEQRFRDFAETASDWFWEHDSELRFTFISPQAQERTGEDQSELIGRRPGREGLLGVSDEAWQAHMEDLRAHRPFSDFRFAKATADGRVRHFSVSGKPVLDGTGAFLGYRGTGRDLTAQIEAEQFLRQVVDTIPAVIAVRDAQHRYRLVNEFYAAQLRTTAAEAEGRVTGSFLGAVRASKVNARDAQVLETGKPLGPYEQAMANAAGEDRIWLVQKVPLLSTAGRPQAVLTVGMDVTTLKQTQAKLVALQKKLRHDERRARDFAEISAHITWEMGPDLRITQISKSVEAITGHPAAHFIGKRNIDLDPDDEGRMAFERLLERHELIRDFLYSRLGPGGRRIHMMFSAKPIFDEQGAFLGYRGTTRDVTAQRLAEQESERLRTARDIASAADMAKTRFLANMSHELRTPLNAILGFAEIMGAEMFGPLGATQYVGYMQDIRKSGEHLMQIINTLLEMTRIELVGFKLTHERIDLATLVAAGIAEASESAERAGAPVARAAIDPAWAVDVDPRAIRQVLANLVSNALRFTPADGRVEVRVRPDDGGGVSILIADTGSGIPAAKLSTVFEPFQAGSGLTARKGQGAGLGLWVSRTLCGLHGGSLTIDSVEGRGTTAIMSLPAERVVGRPAA